MKKHRDDVSPTAVGTPREGNTQAKVGRAGGSVQVAGKRQYSREEPECGDGWELQR